MDRLLLILTLKHHTQTLSKRFPHNIQGPGAVLDPQFLQILGSPASCMMARRIGSSS